MKYKWNYYAHIISGEMWVEWHAHQVTGYYTHLISGEMWVEWHTKYIPKP